MIAPPGPGSDQPITPVQMVVMVAITVALACGFLQLVDSKYHQYVQACKDNWKGYETKYERGVGCVVNINGQFVPERSLSSH